MFKNTICKAETVLSTGFPRGVTLGLRPVTVKLNFRLYFNQDGGGRVVRAGKVENRVSRTISLFKSILLIVRRDNALN